MNKIKSDSLNCLHCNKLCKNRNSLSNHQRLCTQNPNRQSTAFMDPVVQKNKKKSNQFIKAEELGLQPPVVSRGTVSKILETKRQNGTLAWTEERKNNHSSVMKLAVEEHPESYTSSNRGRTKQIEKYGIKFQGSWELIYYEWCLINSIKIERCVERFPYEWDGIRTYNPDFYHPDTNTYIEVKGYETDRDRCKWKNFPHKLSIIRKKEIYEFKRFLEELK